MDMSEEKVRTATMFVEKKASFGEKWSVGVDWSTGVCLNFL